MVHHHWTDEEREIVRRDYAYTHVSRRQLAVNLRVTESAIAGQVARMGIAKKSDRQRWDPQQDQILERLIGQKSPARIAKIMKRSVNSVVVRSKRLGLSRRQRYGWFTKTEVAEILGVGHRWIQQRIDSGVLKATWYTDHKPGKGGQALWHIDATDLGKFIRKYCHELNGRNVDLMQLVHVLVGVPPLPSQI